MTTYTIHCSIIWLCRTIVVIFVSNFLKQLYTDLTITTEKLMELFALLDPRKVDELGDDLGLPQSEIDRIQKDYQSPTQRKEAYLDLYVHQHPCPTWSQVAEVLRNWVNLLQQADLVENTYIKGTQSYQLRHTGTRLNHTVRLSIINTMIVCVHNVGNHNHKGDLYCPPYTNEWVYPMLMQKKLGL